MNPGAAFALKVDEIDERVGCTWGRV